MDIIPIDACFCRRVPTAVGQAGAGREGEELEDGGGTQSNTPPKAIVVPSLPTRRRGGVVGVIMVVVADDTRMLAGTGLERFYR